MLRIVTSCLAVLKVGKGGGYIPAISNHAHAIILRLAVESCCLLHILLAANTLRVAESSFSHSIDIAPLPGNLEAAESQGFILVDSPTIEVD